KQNPLFFNGKWVNTQYQQFSNPGGQERLRFYVSPQFILIDSSYNCTLILKYEQKAELGKPVLKSTFGNTRVLKYKKNYTLVLTEIPGSTDMISINFYSVPCEMIFRRMK
ncbi:MAG: hypothetical protein ACXVLT_07715, partial [Flavisolibacter sp.]